MKKIIEYSLIEEGNIYKLNESVNKGLKDGWELYGSPCSLYIGSEYYYQQAMVKYEDRSDWTIGEAGRPIKS